MDNPHEEALEPTPNQDDWSDFIGCIEAEPDLSRNYKTYLIPNSDEVALNYR
jgi:hypothetical protein